MPRLLPGPGDPATWPTHTNHPGDPRHDDLSDDADIEALAEALSYESQSIGDAMTCIDDESAWPAIEAAIAQRDAPALLQACVAAVMPQLRGIAAARLRAS